jgi:hypothetical protein
MSSQEPPSIDDVFKDIARQGARPYNLKADKEAAETRRSDKNNRRYKKEFNDFTQQYEWVSRETTPGPGPEGSARTNFDYLEEPVDFGTLPPEYIQVPTNTTAYSPNASKPGQPRTVAAAYDPDKETLTVMFLDSTLYNYMKVSKAEWNAFKTNSSPGAYIWNTLNNKPRGRADDINIPENQLKQARNIADLAQKQAARRGKSKVPMARGTGNKGYSKGGGKKSSANTYKPIKPWNPNKFGEL